MSDAESVDADSAAAAAMEDARTEEGTKSRYRGIVKDALPPLVSTEKGRLLERG
jgi:hypothetical protein